MTGYRNRPDQTAEAIDADGWLHTGDIAQIDEDGYVTIVDRKKEIIINAAGKNMSPANIESTMKGAGAADRPHLRDRRRGGRSTRRSSCSTPTSRPRWRRSTGSRASRSRSSRTRTAIRAAVQEAVDAGNAELARVEQIKKFTIVKGDWAPGGDELTPTMKLKRKPIAENYAAEIEAMYG